MIVTIDGPAGAGKSSAARALARRLDFRFLDTGAMYRAVALAAMQRDLAGEDADALVHLARDLDIRVSEDQVLVDGHDVTREIRTMAVTSATRFAANNPGVRAILVGLQRAAAAGLNVVTEGRDQGTVVFPNAECKFFLTAGAEERAKRRMKDLAARGEHVAYALVLAQQEARDRQDCSRAVGPLVPACDAIEIPTDGLTPEQVVDRLEQLARERLRLEK